MNTEQVRRLLSEGQTPRQIAKQLGYSRKEVEGIADGLASAKRTRNLKRVLIPLLALLAIGLVSLVTYNALKEPDNLEVYSKIVKAADGLPSTKGGYSWFIEDGKEPRQEEGIKAEIALIEQLTARVDKTLNDNADVSQAKEEQEMFGGHLMPSIFSPFQGGTTRILSTNAAIGQDPQKLEVVFFGHQAFEHPHIKHRLLFYDPVWKSLFIAALKFTDNKWYDAILAHELLHAMTHRKGLPTATAPFMSDEWITEELWAHDMEADVLSARTNGAYKQRLQSIASGISARSLKRFLGSVRPEDLRQLDQLFAPGLPEEVDIRAAEYLFNLAEVWLDSHYKGVERGEKRIEAYRYLIDPRQSTNVQ